jgi:hypothetical protein
LEGSRRGGNRGGNLGFALLLLLVFFVLTTALALRVEERVVVALELLLVDGHVIVVAPIALALQLHSGKVLRGPLGDGDVSFVVLLALLLACGGRWRSGGRRRGGWGRSWRRGRGRERRGRCRLGGHRLGRGRRCLGLLREVLDLRLRGRRGCWGGTDLPTRSRRARLALLAEG